MYITRYASFPDGKLHIKNCYLCHRLGPVSPSVPSSELAKRVLQFPLIFILVLAPFVLFSETIAERKVGANQKNHVVDRDAEQTNIKLLSLREKLKENYRRVDQLFREGADEKIYEALLADVRRVRAEIAQTEEAWRQSVVTESKQDEEGYAVWDQEETTVSQLSMEFGSSDFLYIVPPDIAGFKIHLHSNIPIPRESWNSVLESILLHNGIGVKKVNSYARQLYVLKQDMGSVQVVAHTPEQLSLYENSQRIFYLFSPPVEHVRTTFQFFEKFSDSKQTFVQQLGSKIALVSSKEEIEKLLSLYHTVWQGGEGKVSRVVSIFKMGVKEMEKILTSFFGESMDKSRPPFGKQEPDNLTIFPLGQSNTLVLIGNKDVVDRAEKIVKETEEQLQDPAEMTVYVYNCRHSNPNDLAQLLEKVYLSLLSANQDTPIKQTEVSFAAQTPTGKVPDGYPPMPPLVVAPTPLKPGLSSKLEVEQGPTDHFIPDPKTGSLLMTVRRDALPKIKELLKKLDVPKRMVQIEVLLFERKLESQNNFGLNLLRLGKPHNGATYMNSSWDSKKGEHAGKGVLQFFFHGGGSKYLPPYDIAYNFLMTQEDIQLNAAPSVITVNQTAATVNIVEELSINNGAAPVNASSGNYVFEKSYARAQYGIMMTLTPTIHLPDTPEEKGLVTLKTKINFDTTRPGKDEDDRPRVDRRGIESEVRVADGETIILGGLRKKAKQDHEDKVPFFGEIPGIGKLFGSTRLTDHDTEMFFFITPKIIYDTGEELDRIRTEDLKKRPGDIPPFLEKVVEATNKEKNRFFRQTMQIFFNNDR